MLQRRAAVKHPRETVRDLDPGGRRRPAGLSRRREAAVSGSAAGRAPRWSPLASPAVDLLALRWLPLVPCSDERPSPTVVGEMVPDPQWNGPPGILHGGMCAALLDECMGALSHGVDRIATVTVTLDLRFRLPVPLDGRPVRVEAWRDHPDLRRRNRVHGRLILADGSAAVEATALMLNTGQAV